MVFYVILDIVVLEHMGIALMGGWNKGIDYLRYSTVYSDGNKGRLCPLLI